MKLSSTSRVPVRVIAPGGIGGCRTYPPGNTHAQNSIYAPCLTCYSGLKLLCIPSHSSYHVISARGRRVHPGAVGHVSNLCSTLQNLTPKPSITMKYVLVAATGEYTLPLNAMLFIPSSSPYLIWHPVLPTVWDRVHLVQETQTWLNPLHPGSLLNHSHIYR